MRNFVLLAGVVSTLVVWNSFYDPINLPKMFVLAGFATWLLGTIAVNVISTRSTKFSLGFWATVLFIATTLIAAALTDVRYTAFFGALQRNVGAITYLSFAIVGLAAMLSFDLVGVEKLLTTLLFLGAILMSYGLLQVSGHDPLKWVLLYSPVIGTTGNPDFLSAILGVCALASGWALLNYKSVWIRFASAILLLAELFVVKKTESIQGLIAFAIGFALILLIKVWQLNRRFGLALGIVLIIVSIPGLLGFAGRGPLAGRLFRSSIRNRIDYWHAALSMFKAHPLLGVGLDRFGENYGLYAPQIQVVHGQITNNAHNVLLQLLATGGLLVFLPYVFLIGVIFHAFGKAVRMARGPVQFNLVAIFAIWFSLLLISIISIDNVSVTVWFWISGGALYRVSIEIVNSAKATATTNHKSRKQGRKEAPTNASLLAPIVSTVLTVVVLILLVPALKTSASILRLESNRDQLSPALYVQKMKDVGNSWPRNPQTTFMLSDLALRIQRPDLGLKFALNTIAMDSKTNFGRQLAAASLENEKKFSDAISFRRQLMKLDPWNTASMVILVKDYLANKDNINANAISAKITKLYPNSADAKTAATLIKG